MWPHGVYECIPNGQRLHPKSSGPLWPAMRAPASTESAGGAGPTAARGTREVAFVFMFVSLPTAQVMRADPWCELRVTPDANSPSGALP